MTNTYAEGKLVPTHDKITNIMLTTKFYHGTTSNLPIKHKLLPAKTTGIQREDWRRKYLDKVFFTSSLMSAIKYAKKACKKYGGHPVVYVVKPQGFYYNTVNTEYISDGAFVLEKIEYTS